MLAVESEVAQMDGEVGPEAAHGRSSGMPVGQALGGTGGQMGVCNEGDTHAAHSFWRWGRARARSMTLRNDSLMSQRSRGLVVTKLPHRLATLKADWTRHEVTLDE
jgi:hypothetical protein